MTRIVAKIRYHLGSACVSLGQYDNAIEYFQLALEGFGKSLGQQHPYTKTVQNNLDAAREKATGIAKEGPQQNE